MTPATAAQAQQMDRKVADVRAALEAAEKASADAIAGQNIGGTLLGSLVPGAGLLWWAAPAVLTSDGSQAVAGSIRRARETFTRWADAEGVQGYRRWALRGSEPDGKGGFRPYSVAFWLSIGDALLSEMGTAKKEAAISTNLSAAQQTGRELKSLPGKALEEAEKALKPFTDPWPLKWKVTAGVVGAGAVAAALGFLLRQVNTLTGRETK